MRAKRQAPLMRTEPDSLETIAARHTPSMIEGADDNSNIVGVLICSRDEEVWPCDCRIALDKLGVPRPPGARRGVLDYTTD